MKTETPTKTTNTPTTTTGYDTYQDAHLVDGNDCDDVNRNNHDNRHHNCKDDDNDHRITPYDSSLLLRE